MRLIIGCLPIPHHSHDIWKRNTGPIILVRIKEDTQTLELVRRTKDRTLCSALLSEPESKAITMQAPGAVDLELEFDFPVRGCEWHAREDPSLLRGAVCCEPDVSKHTKSAQSFLIAIIYQNEPKKLPVCADHRVPPEIEPAALEIRVEVWLLLVRGLLLK